MISHAGTCVATDVVAARATVCSTHHPRTCRRRRLENQALEMDAYLMGTSGLQLGFEQAHFGSPFDQVENRVRELPFNRIDFDPAFAVGACVFGQRCLDVLPVVHPLAPDRSG